MEIYGSDLLARRQHFYVQDDVMAAILKVWRHIWPRQSMCIYLKNNPAKFHPDPIWNDGALDFFWRNRPNKNKMSSDMRSVPDLKEQNIASK